MTLALPIRHMPLDVPPSQDIPAFGPRCEVNGLTVEYVSSSDLEVNVELPQHCLSVNLRGAEAEIALGSDRFDKLAVPPAGIVFYPAGTPLKLASKDSGPYMMVLLAPERFDTMVLEGLGAGSTSPYPLLGYCDPTAQTVAATMRDALLAPSPLSRISLHAGATILALHAARAMARPAGWSGATPPKSDLRRAIDFIEANVAATDLGTRMLAQVLDIPAELLHAAFRNSFGMTPAQYVFQRRIAHALAHVAGGATLDDAAQRSGLGDAARLDQVLRARAASAGPSPASSR